MSIEYNKIYRHSTTTANAYDMIKQDLTDAFTEFTSHGVSFETLSPPTVSTEEYLIYLNSGKTMYLRLVVESNSPVLYICTKDITTGNIVNTKLYASSTSGTYRTFNFAVTRYGVCFTSIRPKSSSQYEVDDSFFINFFTVGDDSTPNMFVGGSNANPVATTYAKSYIYSDAHLKLEDLSWTPSKINTETVYTLLCKMSSPTYGVECKHLYMRVFSKAISGKVKIGDKYFILGAEYALEYDIKDGE